ncbi:MAG TPA: hypothetical protein VFF76_01625 [Holophagaceae bacterium]|jgi:hypothetical protein|nr:hypothetical protein [Holophagaceae bacterium]
MNRRIASLATLFAAGAFAVAATPATTTRTSADTLLTQKGCGADKDKQASCSADKKADKKDKKDASCSADKMKADKKKADSKDKKQASCSADKGKKDAACGKGSCGSAK